MQITTQKQKIIFAEDEKCANDVGKKLVSALNLLYPEGGNFRIIMRLVKIMKSAARLRRIKLKNNIKLLSSNY
jgi:hypothetical protein